MALLSRENKPHPPHRPWLRSSVAFRLIEPWQWRDRGASRERCALEKQGSRLVDRSWVDGERQADSGRRYRRIWHSGSGGAERPKSKRGAYPGTYHKAGGGRVSPGDHEAS